MKTLLLTPHDIKNTLTPLFDKYEFVRCLYQNHSGLSITANLKQTIAEPVAQTRGVVISVLHNGCFYEASSSVSSIKEINKLVHGLLTKVDIYKIKNTDISLIQEDTLEQHFESVQGEDYSLQEKIKKAQNIVHEIKSFDEDIVMSHVRFKHNLIEEFYISKKRLLSQKISRFEAMFIAIIQNKSGESTQVYDGYSYQGGWERMNPPQDLLSNMIVDGKKILGAPRLQPGMYDCIFSPDMTGILAHEAFGHGTEADTMLKGRAKGSDYINQRVASNIASIYDSPALEKCAGSYFFDNEGQIATTTKIVENGILKRPITDHRSASLLKIDRSSNGRRESYHHKIYSRMTNTYFIPGNDELDSMISSISDGYFVKRATNGMEDPKGWGIQLEALYAEEIKNGKLTGRIFSPVIVTGYVPDILNSISMASKTMEISGLGMCGKGHKEWVKVTDGGPYLKLQARLA